MRALASSAGEQAVKEWGRTTDGRARLARSHNVSDQRNLENSETKTVQNSI